MTIHVFRSTDVDAPILTGDPGQLIVVLDKCLVDGYGSGGDLKNPVGWTKEFSGTNKAIYRLPAGSSQTYMRINDDNPFNNSHRTASIQGAMGATDVDTITDVFPDPNATYTEGLYIDKADDNNSTPRDWVMIADDFCFHLFISPFDTSTYQNHFTGYFFGDLISYKAGDAYHCSLIANTNKLSSYPGQFSTYMHLNSTLSSLGGHYTARSYSQLGLAIEAGKFGSGHSNGGGIGLGSYHFQYPGAADNGLYLSPIYWVDAGTDVLRGRLPGILQPLHDLQGVTNSGDVFDNIDGLPGRDVMTQTVSASST